MRRFVKFLLTAFIAFFSVQDNYSQVAQAPAELKSVPPIVKANDPNKPENKLEQYWFVVLKSGSRQGLDSIAREKLFNGHMNNIVKLYNDGILKVAGPFGKNDLNWRGIFIFDCKTKEEVEKFISNDPAIAAGLLAVDIVPWYSEPVGSFRHGKPEKLND